MKYDHTKIYNELERNMHVFDAMLRGISKDDILWSQSPEKWNLLFIVCHLYDEEREDFRARLKHMLETPNLPLPRTAPLEWVTERDYKNQDYNRKLDDFIKERKESLVWLRSLNSPPWDNIHQHPQVGPISAWMFLVNWVAHDYLHFRQITKLRFDHLAATKGESLKYAGDW